MRGLIELHILYPLDYPSAKMSVLELDNPLNSISYFMLWITLKRNSWVTNETFLCLEGER